MYYAATHHTKIIQEIFTNKNPPAGRTGGLSAVTLPFLQLKLGRKESPAQVFPCREFCFLPAYASEFFCEGTAYKLVSHAGIYSWCRIYKS